MHAAFVLDTVWEENLEPARIRLPGTYGTHFFCTLPRFSLRAAGLYSRSQPRGPQGSPPVFTAHILGSAGLRGACSGGSKSLELAGNDGIAFRRAIANQAHGNTQSKIHLNFSPLFCGLYQSSRQRLGSHCTTAAPQAFYLL